MNERDLRRALALDEDELAYLRAAALPALFVARVASNRRSARRERWYELLSIVALAALGYAGWLVAAPAVGQGLSLARQTGVATIVVAELLRGAWGGIDRLASIVEAASAVPGFHAPLILVSLLASVAYALGVGTPSVRRRPSAV